MSRIPLAPTYAELKEAVTALATGRIVAAIDWSAVHCAPGASPDEVSAMVRWKARDVNGAPTLDVLFDTPLDAVIDCLRNMKGQSDD